MINGATPTGRLSGVGRRVVSLAAGGQRRPGAYWPGSSTSTTSKRPAVTGAHEVLIGHHRALRTMMRRFDELFSAPEPDRRQLLNTLSAELQIHEQTEDEDTGGMWHLHQESLFFGLHCTLPAGVVGVPFWLTSETALALVLATQTCVPTGVVPSGASSPLPESGLPAPRPLEVNSVEPTSTPRGAMM